MAFPKFVIIGLILADIDDMASTAFAARSKLSIFGNVFSTGSTIPLFTNEAIELNHSANFSLFFMILPIGEVLKKESSINPIT